MYPKPIRQKNELGVDGLINYSHSLRTHRRKVKHNHEKTLLAVIIPNCIQNWEKVKNSSPESLFVYCRPAVYQQLTDS